ncbi:TPR Domain containing protein [Tritrichomonas foetus]|uniref:TPR Domain containing protein n=1 Tax=Tritrichomonas foetus TaxID=1144522 RepID=A0A1J4L481_9EUKA|nr:TPR Domain containing protein [Tritrichomonas foetus]|eukprot:OHT16733.1 TPR Domain containing protein [Tritrichomonas foetus]
MSGSNVFDPKAIEKANAAFESAWNSVFELVEESKMESQTHLAARRLLSYNPQHKIVEEKCPVYYGVVNSLCSVITEKIQGLSKTESAENWTTLLFCYLLMNDMPNAYSAVQHNLRLRPKIKDTYFNYCAGIVYQHFHYFEDAIGFYMQIPESFEHFTDRNLRLAIAYRSISKYSEAESLFRNLLKRPPQNLSQNDIKLQLAYTLQLAERNLESSKIYEELYHQFPNCVELKQQYIWFLSIQNDSKSWVKADELIGTSADSVLRFASARISMKQRNMGIAYQRYRECTSAWSDSPLFWCGLGVLYLRNEQLSDAVIAFQRALYLKSDIPEAWLNLGLIFEIQGENPNALKIYQTAQSNCPNAKIVNKRINECGRPSRKSVLEESAVDEVIEIDGNRLFTQPMERISDLIITNPPFLSESCFTDKTIKSQLQNLMQPHMSLLH